jgi:GNAT superfamily N-acetyltransferase
VNHRFYRFDPAMVLAPDPGLNPVYRISDWRPARDGAPPTAIATSANRIWQVFDRIGLFANRGCGVLMISDGDMMVHHSLITPRWFRFPAMAADDLQIGATWTAPEHRGRGLAAAAVHAIHRRWAGQFARMWYLCEDDNAASIKVIERCGYRLIGTGARTSRLGLSALGQFVIQNHLTGDNG